MGTEKKKTDLKNKKLGFYKNAILTIKMGGSVAAPTTLPCCSCLCRGRA